jgi:hypothetical protein
VRDIVHVTGVRQLIEDRDASFGENLSQVFGDMGPDEPGAPGHHNFHHYLVSTSDDSLNARGGHHRPPTDVTDTR